MTKVLENKLLLFLGDHHGNWNELFYLILKHDFKDCQIISVGDVGIGFKYKKEYEYESCKKVNSFFNKRNINFYGIRGNHDDPYFFKGKGRVALSNFETIEDYSVFEYNNKKIQFIGGAVSIDRTGRKEGVSYWSNEGVDYKPELLEEVDILVTHTAPSFCFPQQFNEMVYGWAREDAYLLEDLTVERAIMDEIFKKCKPQLHLYGHFHCSCTESINNCKHKLLNINEFWELTT